MIARHTGNRQAPSPQRQKLERFSRRDLLTLVCAIRAGGEERWRRAGVRLADIEDELRRRAREGGR